MAKFRTSFVTNSSSSSFICEVCGNVESGMDLSRSDVGFVQCANGHDFCEHHQLPFEVNKEKLKETLRELINDNLEDYREYNRPYYKTYAEDYQLMLDKVDDMTNEEAAIEYLELFDGEIPSDACPICTLETVRDSDIVSFIQKETGRNIEKEIQERFKSLDELKKYIKE